MPMQSVIIIGGIVAAFAIYAATLAWADFYSRNHHQPQ
jgi:H+/gluconate symporter-like permease